MPALSFTQLMLTLLSRQAVLIPPLETGKIATLRSRNRLSYLSAPRRWALSEQVVQHVKRVCHIDDVASIRFPRYAVSDREAVLLRARIVVPYLGFVSLTNGIAEGEVIRRRLETGIDADGGAASLPAGIVQKKKTDASSPRSRNVKSQSRPWPCSARFIIQLVTPST
jgi:hypothetical protein